jgi:ectoine hydroxylase-related dioxygenase (phytanoyl-CoA dioxygenase family)
MKTALDSRSALAALGASEDLLTDTQRRSLDDDGYVVMPSVLTRDQVDALARRFDELVKEEGQQAGIEVHQEEGADRLSDLVNKDALFDLVWTNPLQLSAAGHVLGWESVQFSSLNCRSAKPGYGLQQLHMDGEPAAAVGDYEVCNSLWMLDDFTEENGATRVVPGSHRWRQVPGQVLDDAMADHPEQVLVTGTAGTLVVFNAHLWHGGTVNNSTAPRRAAHSYYTRRHRVQQTVQRDFIRPATLDRLSDAHQYLMNL